MPSLKSILIKEDKIKLIISIKAKRTYTVQGYNERICKAVVGKITTLQELQEKGFVVEKHFVPYCYNWNQCYFDYRQCVPKHGCLLEEDNSLLNNAIKKVVDDLYQMRSDFVHNATITPLNERDAVFTLGTSGRKPVLIELTIQDLEDIFEKALKHYFDQLT